MAGIKNAHDDHRCGTGRTEPGAGRYCRVLRWRIVGWRGVFYLQQIAGLRQLLHPRGVGHPAIMADAVEAFGQDVQEETADELIGVEGHGLVVYGVTAVILVPEGDSVVVIGDEPGIGDGDAVGIAAEVLEHGLGPSEQRTGILPIVTAT